MATVGGAGSGFVRASSTQQRSPCSRGSVVQPTMRRGCRRDVGQDAGGRPPGQGRLNHGTLRITHDAMTQETGNRVVATALVGEHAAAGGNGAWIVSTYPALLFTRDQAITSPAVAELMGSGQPRFR